MMKKVISILLLIGMLINLAGCGQKEVINKAEGGEKGGYVENEISLPEEIDSENIFQIGKKGDNLCIYVKEIKDETIKIACYIYKDGKFQKETPAWLESITLSKTFIVKVIEDVNGKSYLYYASEDDTEMLQGHLYCTEDGLEAEDITPPDWLIEVPEYHFYDYPSDLVILQDNSIAANFNYHSKIYDGESRTIITEFMLSRGYTEQIYAYKDEFYLMELNDNWEFAGINVYKQGTDSPKSTISSEEKIGSESYMDILSDGSIVVCGSNGIFKQDATSKEWSKLIGGVSTGFALETIWCLGLTALDSGNCYAIFNNESSERMLMEYVYDPELVTEPETILSIYSVYDNPTVKQAAAMYNRLHPEVLIEVEIGIPYEDMETADKNTVLQNLNVRLLAGEGPDIMVLDGLNADSFVEKGLLVDISDVVTPMSEDGIILKNIADGYTYENGAVYIIPLKYSVNILVGRTIDAKEANTLKGLAEALSKQQESVLGPMTADTLATNFVPYITADIVDGKALNKEALSETLELIKVIAENCGVVEKYTDTIYYYSIWDIASNAGAAFSEAPGFLEVMLPVSAANLVKGSFYSFENAYKPIGEMGISADSPNSEEAKAFLQYALSFDVQDGDFYDGFAINIEALENQMTKDRSGYAAYTSIDIGGGQSADFIINPVTEEEGKAIIEMCKHLDKKVIEDEQIRLVIAEALPAYLDGSSSMEETVTKIEKNLNMYLAE